MCSRWYFKPTYSESMAILDFEKSLLLHIVNKLSSSYYMSGLIFFPVIRTISFFTSQNNNYNSWKKPHKICTQYHDCPLNITRTFNNEVLQFLKQFHKFFCNFYTQLVGQKKPGKKLEKSYSKSISRKILLAEKDNQFFLIFLAYYSQYLLKNFKKIREIASYHEFLFQQPPNG